MKYYDEIIGKQNFNYFLHFMCLSDVCLVKLLVCVASYSQYSHLYLILKCFALLCEDKPPGLEKVTLHSSHLYMFPECFSRMCVVRLLVDLHLYPQSLQSNVSFPCFLAKCLSTHNIKIYGGYLQM